MMHKAINFAVAAAAILQYTSAAPAPKARSVGSVVLPQIANEKFVANGMVARAKAIKKYGGTMPQELSDALGVMRASHGHQLDSGSATANPADANDSEYLVPIQIGTPAVTFQLDLDTGSSDLWVFGSSVSGASSNHTIYNPEKSSTSQTTSDTWTISYGDGSSASGNVYTDTVSLGDITAPAQAVEMATQVSSEFLQTSGDGLMGLAFETLNTATPDQQTPFWQTVSSNLDQQLFVADLKYHAAGSYVFGAIPDGAGDVTYTPLSDQQGYWSMNAAGWGFGGQQGDNSSQIAGIADTGTTLMLLDDSIVSAYYGAIDGATNSQEQQGWVIPDGTDAPDFDLYIEDATITIPGAYMCFAEVGDGTCYGGLQSNSDLNGLSIFGDVALKAAYVVFDFGNSQIGWAQKA